MRIGEMGHVAVAEAMAALELGNGYWYGTANPASRRDPSGMISIGFGLGQLTEGFVKYVTDYVALWTTDIAHQKIVEAFSRLECASCLIAETAAYEVAAGAKKSLLGHRAPQYIFYGVFQLNNTGHYEALKNQQAQLLKLSVDMAIACETPGYRALTSWYTFLALWNFKLPSLPGKGAL
jgi:hypothetical protein